MARIRLLAAPYAGAGASAFYPLANALPDWIEPWALQAPGREDRLSESLITDWAAFETFLTDALAGWSGARLAVYGHSLGALSALAAARCIETERPGALAHAFFAARPAPTSPTAAQNFDDPPEDDAQLAAALDQRFGAPPASFANEDVRALAAPILRADLKLLQSFQNEERAPLACSATALIGADDPSMTLNDAEGWARETNGTFVAKTLKAGHYFVSTHPEDVAAIIATVLSA